jgi:hypothetical protein
LRVQVVKSEKLVAQAKKSLGTTGRRAFAIGSHYKATVIED